KQLDDIVCSDKERCIRLFRIDGTHVFDRDKNVFRKARRRCELDSTLVGFDGPRGAQIFEHKRDKARIGGGVEQAAFRWPRAHGGQRARILPLPVEPGPFDGQWQQITRGFAPASDLEQRNSQVGLGGSDWHAADDMSRWWVPSFCIPAPARKKSRKDVVLENRFGTAAQQRPPAVGDDERLEFNPGPRDLDRRCIRLAEQEPKEFRRAQASQGRDLRRSAESSFGRAVRNTWTNTGHENFPYAAIVMIAHGMMSAVSIIEG